MSVCGGACRCSFRGCQSLAVAKPRFGQINRDEGEGCCESECIVRGIDVVALRWVICITLTTYGLLA